MPRHKFSELLFYFYHIYHNFKLLICLKFTWCLHAKRDRRQSNFSKVLQVCKQTALLEILFVWGVLCDGQIMSLMDVFMFYRPWMLRFVSGLAGAGEESKPQRHTGGQLAPSHWGRGRASHGQSRPVTALTKRWSPGKTSENMASSSAFF